MATAWKSASTAERVTRRRLVGRAAAVAVVLGVLVLRVAPAHAGLELEKFQGYLAGGYGKLFVADAPGGSLSLGAGADYPVSKSLRVGVAIGSHLLGSRTVVRGSLLSDVDYGMFETVVLLNWTPPWSGPLGLVSIGPGVFNAKADLSASAGGAEFEDLAVHETRPGFTASATFISRKPSPLRLGLELGAHVAFTHDETWTVGTARVTVRY